jgi:hypothetical protein
LPRPQPNERRSVVALRAAVGFALGLGFWIGARGPYHDLLAAGAAPMLRLLEPAVSWVRPVGEKIFVDRTDLPGQNAQLDPRVFTFNLIILFTLFAANARALSRRNLGRFAIALAVLTVTHMIAIVAGAESVFSRAFGEWSDTHYSAFATDASLIVAQGYMLVGGYAVVFALWWALRGGEAEPAAAAPAAKTPRRASRARR